MYGWIWRHLPFGLKGKIVSSVLLVTGVAALLWFVVFPYAEPLLPFGVDVQVSDTGGRNGTEPDGVSVQPGPGGTTLNPSAIPYSTTSNNTAPGSAPAGGTGGAAPAASSAGR